MTLFKIDYEINGYAKFLVGTIQKDEPELLTIISRDGKEFRISKQTIREMREWTP